MAGPVLWLFRHGKAADAVGFKGGDAARPLVARGQAQAQESGARLAELAPHIDAVLTSPRLRALQTASIAAQAHGRAPEPVVIDELGGDYGLRALLALASPWLEAPGATNVVVVGHNPTLSVLAHELSGDERGLKTGAFAGVDLADRSLVEHFTPTAR